MALPGSQGDRLTERGFEQAREVAERLGRGRRHAGADQPAAAGSRDGRGDRRAPRPADHGGGGAAGAPGVGGLRRALTGGPAPASLVGLDGRARRRSGSLISRRRVLQRDHLSRAASARSPGRRCRREHHRRLPWHLSALLPHGGGPGTGFRAAQVRRLWQLGSVNSGVCEFEHRGPHLESNYATDPWRCLSWMAPAPTAAQR